MRAYVVIKENPSYMVWNCISFPFFPGTVPTARRGAGNTRSRRTWTTMKKTTSELIQVVAPIMSAHKKEAISEKCVHTVTLTVACCVVWNNYKRLRFKLSFYCFQLQAIVTKGNEFKVWMGSGGVWTSVTKQKCLKIVDKKLIFSRLDLDDDDEPREYWDKSGFAPKKHSSSSSVFLIIWTSLNYYHVTETIKTVCEAERKCALKNKFHP